LCVPKSHLAASGDKSTKEGKKILSDEMKSLQGTKNARNSNATQSG